MSKKHTPIEEDQKACPDSAFENPPVFSDREWLDWVKNKKAEEIIDKIFEDDAFDQMMKEWTKRIVDASEIHLERVDPRPPEELMDVLTFDSVEDFEEWMDAL